MQSYPGTDELFFLKHFSPSVIDQVLACSKLVFLDQSKYYLRL